MSSSPAILDEVGFTTPSRRSASSAGGRGPCVVGLRGDASSPPPPQQNAINSGGDYPHLELYDDDDKVIVEQALVARANAVQPSSPPAAPWAPKKRALAGRGRTAPDTPVCQACL
jgi:hypothetical protein